ncbi:hypothetical protein DF185_22595 [Marinifilum breve]|uniref:Uncharacterized protein n=1 Tax=Marinifilum breve TaxID=2184082 RepID=A0A2V4A4Q8_9BACT|nr:hypothetical protein [Marinifilum breve]PXX95171.1 hypothetical protein DF185_22595 [Marinifilum breve]
MKKNSLILIALIFVFTNLKAEKLSWEGVVSFTHNKQNEVAYLELNDIAITGAIEVTIFGGWNRSASFGKLTRLFSFYHPKGRNEIHEYSSEVITAHGNIAKTYGIGDMIAHNNKIRIPIYKLNAYSATGMHVHIDIYSNVASTIKNNLSLTETFSEDIGPRPVNKRSFNTLAIGSDKIPNGYSLAVKGNAVFDEVQVKATTNWPDYVFEEDYSIQSLEEVEQFIQNNKHLPNMPSAKEVESEGIGLAKMNKLLLQKIEELTLYTIEQQKILKQQGNKIEELEKRINQENNND